MINSTSKMRRGLLAFLLGALPVGNVLAADIEIYVGSDTEVSGVRPNILFVLDTSGSMDTNVVTQIPYDPNQVYEGNCDSGYVYLSRDNNPSCDSDNWWDWWWGSNDPALAVPEHLFVCSSASSALETTGYYQDRFAQWRVQNNAKKSGWNKNVDSEDRITECEDDYGTHGQADGNAAKWPADGNKGPFSSNSKDGIRWNSYNVYTAYSGNYLNWMNNSTTIVKSRIDIMKEVFKATLDSINNVNVGLMRFDRYANGGMVVHEVANLATARETLKGQIDAMSASGNTPLAETMYEAALYYMGEPVHYGNGSYPVRSVSGARDGSNYKSPIEYQCQKNFIVYLTDGEPTSDTGADSMIRGLTGRYCSGNCLDEVAEHLYTRDLHTGLSGEQNVITYTIGFATDQQLLSDAARKGGGKYYTADDTAELTSALTHIVAEVLAVNSTFTAPAVSVNAFNRTVHLDQLFFTIFKPSDRPHWDGNLKRFDLGEYEGTVQILDKNKLPAVDANTGFFKDSALSWWTLSDQSPDGGEARLGGAAGQISLPRKVFTWLGATSTLDTGSNAFHEDNGAISKAMLGIDGATDSYRNTLIQWARGVDLDDEDDDGSTTDGRRIMGDPLHSKPVVVTYGGDSENLDFTVFMTTNDGYLHAVDAQSGQEHFAFIPKEVLPNLDKLYQNTAGTDSKVYGLDSPLTAWINDINGNGIVEPNNGDHVYIYFGQRRGGRNYYALDVTNRSDPKFLWHINNNTAGFAELGQTWSQPRVAKVNIGGTVRDVIIFGGGYDTNQDTADSYLEDTVGRAIYMVDAESGALLWRAGPSGSGADLVLDDLKNSIPGEIRVIDVNADGLSDRMYVGDMGGRVFRFDILNGNGASDLVKGGKIASLGAGDSGGTEAENRKFFYAPDAALMVEDSRRWINIAIGSGNQSHPLGKVTQDRLYSFRDMNVYNVPEDYEVVTNADLYDATDNVIGQGDEAASAEALNTLLNEKKGWYIDLEHLGEKSLAESTTFQGSVFFTTFTPVAEGQTSSCAPSQGTARTYVVSARDGTPVFNFNGVGDDDSLTADDRALTLVRGGIPPEVTILFPESNNGQPIALVGPEQLPLNLSNIPVRTYWYEAETSN